MGQSSFVNYMSTTFISHLICRLSLVNEVTVTKNVNFSSGVGFRAKVGFSAHRKDHDNDRVQKFSQNKTNE